MKKLEDMMNKSFKPANLLKIFLALVLFHFSFALPAFSLPRVQGIEELSAIQDEISLLNLLRGLYLSDSQVSELCEIAIEADKAVKSVTSPIVKDKGVILETFADLREKLFQAPGNETSAQKKAQQINERMKEAQGQVLEHLRTLETRAVGVMTSAQLEIVEGFVPCLIPPRDLKNPVRVGQAGAADGPLAKMTDLIYATPEDVWGERKMILLGKVAGKIEEDSGKLSDSMRTDLLNRLNETAKKIRATDPIDFQLKKGNLADELLLIDHSKRGSHKPLGKVGKWFLSETAVKILPRWKNALAAGMDQVAPDDCEDGDFKLEPNTEEMAKKLVNTLGRFYKKNGKNKGLPPFEQIKGIIERAETSKDPLKLAGAVLEAIDSLAPAGVKPPLNKAMVQLVRSVCKYLKLPLISEKHDPYGFFEELKNAQNAGTPEETFKSLRQLADKIVRFKKI
ncbi:MAG: hypothetical protein ACOYXC_18125 [Candidatus Rifleibacteriota bacterium]